MVDPFPFSFSSTAAHKVLQAQTVGAAAILGWELASSDGVLGEAGEVLADRPASPLTSMGVMPPWAKQAA
jgi:hypothetical protein